MLQGPYRRQSEAVRQLLPRWGKMLQVQKSSNPRIHLYPQKRQLPQRVSYLFPLWHKPSGKTHGSRQKNAAFQMQQPSV